MNAVAPAVPSPAAWLFAAAIGGYQRYLSPWKGFRCAYRVQRGRASCSQFAKRVALRRGLLAVPGLLRERFRRCAVAAKALAAKRSSRRDADDDRRQSRAATPGVDCSPDIGDYAARGCEAGVEGLSSCDGIPVDGCDGCDACGAIDFSL